MARADVHSRVVVWLKVALPLGALALLSTLFLLSEKIDPSAAIPYADVDVEALASDPRMTSPAYAGTTEDGTAISLTADAARPAAGNQAAEAAGVSASFDMPDGSSADLTAATVAMDNPAGEARLSGGVHVTTSTGYDVTTEGMTMRLDRSGLASTGPVVATGPAGQITANGFTLTRKTDDAGGNPYLLVFTGQVKLVYLPGG